MPPAVLRCRVYILEGVILLDNTASIACASRLVQRQIPLSSTLCRLLSCGANKFHGLKLLRTLRAYTAYCPAVQSIIICRIIRLKIKFVLFEKRIMPLCRKTKRRLPVFFVVCVLFRIELLRYLPKASTKDAYSLSEICNIAPWRGAKSKL